MSSTYTAYDPCGAFDCNPNRISAAAWADNVGNLGGDLQQGVTQSVRWQAADSLWDPRHAPRPHQPRKVQLKHRSHHGAEGEGHCRRDHRSAHGKRTGWGGGSKNGAPKKCAGLVGGRAQCSARRAQTPQCVSMPHVPLRYLLNMGLPPRSWLAPNAGAVAPSPSSVSEPHTSANSPPSPWSSPQPLPAGSTAEPRPLPGPLPASNTLACTTHGPGPAESKSANGAGLVCRGVPEEAIFKKPKVRLALRIPEKTRTGSRTTQPQTTGRESA